MCVMRDMIRYRPQDAPRPGHASVADNDHLGVLFFGDPQQGLCRLPRPDVGLALNAGAGEPLLCPIDVMLRPGSALILFVSFRRGNSAGRRGQVQAIGALAVAADEVDFEAERLGELTGAIDRTLGSLGAIGSDYN